MNIYVGKFRRNIFKELKDNNLCSLIESVFDECEIKPVDCNKCERQNGTAWCYACLHGKQDNFKQKQNELDSLFIGAPVMAINPMVRTAEWELFTYDGELKFYVLSSEVHRLPTVDEAPRNVWLAPWLSMPEELSNESILIWTKSNEIATYHNPSFPDFAWVNAIKIMILEI